ncbi:MAG: hypothetical protein QMD65_02845, partial [Patescibacteria group bacterium]|nr:hypothetical protein [Patescibacteria group bacterium]
ELYSQGTNVQLLAKPLSSTSTFVAWSGCDSVSSTLCTVVMSHNRPVTATFNAAVKPPSDSKLPIAASIYDAIESQLNDITAKLQELLKLLQ